jgi:hypothetical protein
MNGIYVHIRLIYFGVYMQYLAFDLQADGSDINILNTIISEYKV